MNDFVEGQTVYILMPDFTVVEGNVIEVDDVNKYGNYYKVITVDGRTFHRTSKMIFVDEKHARARKFVNKFKFNLHFSKSLDETWNSEDDEIVELAIDLWPEELL